jgi:glycosyltransferase involved in cell wall biosynthesis
MNKVLIITYYWPPGSGAGVQRWLKFTRYLPSTGWEPYVLTVDPGYAAYPATDNSLLKEISADLKVYHTKATDWFRFYGRDKSKIPSAGFANNDNDTLRSKILRFIRGNFFIPDPRRGWNKYAFKEAGRLIESEGIRTIITTSPPHSTQLIGLKLRKRFPGVTWIADLRDPWTEIYYYSNFYHTLPARKIDGSLEKSVLKNADRIITVGNSLKKSFAARLKGIEEKIEVITNGYDEDDFTGVVAIEPSDFTISYIGTLSDAYPIKGFIDAVDNLAGRGFSIRLRFIGSVSAEQRNLIRSKNENLPTEFVPYVNHEEAIKFMTRSSLLLLVIPDHRSSKSIITGKLFEYLASGRAILCIGPADGDAAGILAGTGHGKCAAPGDVSGMIQIIEEYYASAPEKSMAPPEFSRKYLTGKLATLLDRRG